MTHFFTTTPDITLVTDGSGTGGIGGYTNTGHFFSHQLPSKFNQHASEEQVDSEKGLSSQWIELVALYVAVKTMLPSLANKAVDWYTDSQPAFNAYKNQRATSDKSNYILMQIDAITVANNIAIQPCWHPRTTPPARIADDLSKLILSSLPSHLQAQAVEQHTVSTTIYKSLTTSTKMTSSPSQSE